MDALIADFSLKGVINHAMLIHQALSLESRRHDDQLPMVAATRKVLGFDQGNGKCFG